jgi:glycerate kinase
MTTQIKIGDTVNRTDRDDYLGKVFVVVSETAKRFGVQMILQDGNVWKKTTYVAKHNVKGAA